MLQFAICDDEPHMVRELSGHLAAYMGEPPLAPYRVRSFPDGQSLLESGGGFDVIFLDVQMAPPDGMETARLLRRRGERSLLIFVTVLRECVFDAFEVEASGYLLLERRAGASLVVQRGNACEVVPLAEVAYCEVQGRKLYLHRAGGSVLDYYGRLEDLERRVDRRFFKCHRSYLVNLDYVQSFRDGQVLLPREEAIPVSRLRERELIQALLRRMKERGA